jgi:hypothetical protein
MVVVVAHEPSSLYLGEGFALVERAHAIEFEDERAVLALLERHASEPCFATELVVATSAA